MLTLTPVVCVCGGIVVSEILTTYLDLKRPVWMGGEEPVPETNSKQRHKSTVPVDQSTQSVGNFPLRIY
jgi:hypothetical protein